MKSFNLKYIRPAQPSLSQDMALYQISELETLSGIKAHTIRIWEKRYMLFTPKRTAGNGRRYSDDDLRKLLNISVLVNNGVRISTLEGKSAAELGAMVIGLHEGDQSRPAFADAAISNCVIAAINYNEELFDKTLSEAIEKMGFRKAYTSVVYPFLVRIGLMWGAGEVLSVNEHFTSNLLRQKFFSAINNLPNASADAERWLLFLPQNEQHEIGLLFSYYFLKERGKRVYYLGQNVPEKDLEVAIEELGPEYLLFFIVKHIPSDELQELISWFSAKDVKMILAGNADMLSGLASSKSIQVVSSIEEFEKLLK